MLFVIIFNFNIEIYHYNNIPLHNTIKLKYININLITYKFSNTYTLIYFLNKHLYRVGVRGFPASFTLSCFSVKASLIGLL